MSYKIMNEELNIKGCNISDLSIEQVLDLTRFCNFNMELKKALVFYQSTNDSIIINKGIDNYNNTLDLIVKYINANDVTKSDIKVSCGNYDENIMYNILDKIIFDRSIKKLNTILGLQKFPSTYMDKLKKLFTQRNTGEEFLYFINAFKYGYIEGLRAERLKKKGNRI